MAVFAHEDIYSDVDNNRMLLAAKVEMQRAMTFLDALQFEDYVRYVTAQFAKPVDGNRDYEYIISATIAYSLMYASRFDGIMYPSVRSNGHYGMNVALRDDIADSKLILEDVNEMEYKQQDKKGRFSFLRESEPLSSDANGYKTWRYVPYHKKAVEKL